MKRYLRFCWNRGLSFGAAVDFAGDFASIEEALSASAERDFMNILDTQTGTWSHYDNIQGGWRADTTQRRPNTLRLTGS